MLEFQLNYFRSWEMMLWKCCTQYSSKLENSTVATVLEKSVFVLIPKKGDAKECSNYCTIALISHTSKVMLKILQARLQECMNCELPDVQAVFRKGGGTKDQIANIRWTIKKTREFQKNIHFWLLTMPKPLTVWFKTNHEKIFKRWEYQTTLPASWEIYAGHKAPVRTRLGTADWFQVGKGVHQGSILSPCLFNFYAEYIMGIPEEMKHKLKSRLWYSRPHLVLGHFASIHLIRHLILIRHSQFCLCLSYID